jgi:hypothetical protein
MRSTLKRRVACLAAALLPMFCAQTALASGPTTVTVRIEGLAGTLLPATPVTTTGAPVVKDGVDSCDGFNAAGALDLATGGNWGGKWFGGYGYSVETLLGENHPLSSIPYWGIWHDHVYAKSGVCGQALETGDELLFAPAEGTAPSPLGIQAPASATVGSPVAVKIVSYASATGAATPAEGATIAYDGRSTSSGADGEASLVFADPGTQVVEVSKEGSVRDESTVCVAAPGSNACGAPSGTTTSTQTPGSGEVAGFTTTGTPKGPTALAASVTSPRNGHLYKRGHGPQLLVGKVSAGAAGRVTSVSLSLRRVYRHRCSAYIARRGRFHAARCGAAPSFRVSTNGSFSYFLPNRLAPGRYVLAVQAADAEGDRLKPVEGSSRLVFYVA